MDGKTVIQIVDILSQSHILIENWMRFKDALGLHTDPDFVQMAKQFSNRTITSYELFTKIINRWISNTGTHSTIELLYNILIGIGYNFTADNLKTAFPIAFSSHYKETYFKIPIATSSFVGRVSILEELDAFYCNPNKLLVKIIGMGGVGKSELVKYFANSKRTEVNGLWLNGESAESLLNSIFKFAKALHLQTPQAASLKTSRNIIKDVISYISSQTKKRLLLIIDNVDIGNNEVELVSKKAIKLGCFILVTSRNVTALGVAGDVVNLDVLQDFEAQSLMKNALTEESDEDVQELCKLIQNFPLALQQAIGFIKHVKRTGLLGQSYKIKNFLNDYEKQKTTILDHKLSMIEHKYQSTTMVTWNVSIAQIHRQGEIGDLAIQILHLIIYFEADDISVDFISRIYHRRKNIDDALILLKTFSLLKIENKQISIHRLIQEVTRVNCSHANLELELLQKYIQMIQDSKSTLKESEGTHILCLWKHASKHPAIVNNSTSFPYQIVNKLEKHYLYRDMETFAKESWTLSKEVLGNANINTLKINERLAWSIARNGNYFESLEKYKTVVREQISILGEVEETTMFSRRNMAWVLFPLEKYDEALEIFETLLALRLKAPQINYAEVIALKEDIASCWMRKGQLTEAMHAFEEVLDWKRKELGEENGRTLRTRSYIALCLYEQKEYEKAMLSLEQLLTFKLPPRSLLDTKELLAMVYSALNQREKAVDIQTEVLTGREELLGFQHPDTIWAKQNLDLFSGKR